MNVLRYFCVICFSQNLVEIWGTSLKSYKDLRNKDYKILNNNRAEIYDNYEEPNEYRLAYDDSYEYQHKDIKPEQIATRVISNDDLFDKFQKFNGFTKVIDTKQYDNIENLFDTENSNQKNKDVTSHTYGNNALAWDGGNYFQFENINIVGLANNSSGDIIRPCALDDWQCIRWFLAENSNCIPVYGPIPDPLNLKRNTVYFSNINVTAVLTKVRVAGLRNFKISDFYVSRDTGNLILAIEFKNLNMSDIAYLRYKRTAKESIVLSDFATIEFSSGTFTVVIPRIPHLRLDLAEIHADIDDATPPFFFGPRIANSTDPDVAEAISQLVIQLPVAVRESFLIQSQLFAIIYIQNNICDFGHTIISV